jgi:hypothetical protein
MKKENVPQDMGALGKVTKEVCYATDKDGKYTTELSTGWGVKTEALDVAWHDVEERIAKAKQKVLNVEASPLLFFMEYRLMDIGRLSERKLQKYAEAFNVKVEDIKTMTVNEA